MPVFTKNLSRIAVVASITVGIFDPAAFARGGGGHGGGHSGGRGASSYQAPPAPSHPTGSAGRGRGYGWGHRGSGYGYGNYGSNISNQGAPMSNFQSQQFSGPAYIGPTGYGQFVQTYNWPKSNPAETAAAVAGTATP